MSPGFAAETSPPRRFMNGPIIVGTILALEVFFLQDRYGRGITGHGSMSINGIAWPSLRPSNAARSGTTKLVVGRYGFALVPGQCGSSPGTHSIYPGC